MAKRARKFPVRRRLVRAILVLSALLWLVLLAQGAGLWPNVIAGLLLLLTVGLALLGQSDERAPQQPERQLTSPRFRLALDSLPAPTILVDRRGMVIHANLAAPAMFPGLRTGFPVSAGLRDPDFLSALERVLRGPSREETLELIEPLPVERSFQIIVRQIGDGAEPLPVADGDGFAVIFLQETTQSRRIERARVDFVANASHELRTPLASILGFVETLQGPARDDPAARARFLTIMATQARRMTRLVNDLLSLSRLEMSGHIRPSDVIDLGLIVPMLVDTLSGLAQERKTRVVLHHEPGTSCLVLGDRDELVRLCENLIENAIKYGGDEGRVDISLAEQAENIALSIRDHGPGIAPEHLPRLTERFYRVDVQESRVLGGTGLGLAIVKHIVSRHRGKLEIESELGKGAVFRVLLPAYKKS
jgi:two-component system phosphate regulon sensor histidine kinase PhoR